MKHYGDITKINGAEVPVVDIITGGSPCQDLSVAGKRAGLAGERSGLFMEQMRIVKEMREHDRVEFGRAGRFIRPRYMVWENVPGAFSSNGGKDFQAVLTEIARVAEPDAPDVPLPEKGKWGKAGCLYGAMGEWSIAWRVHDAQFWGVPQRRKRIAIVADFGGLSAPEILFERKGLSRDSEPCGAKREATAGATGEGVEGAGFGETGIGYWQNGIQTLRAEGENRPSRPSNVIVSVHATQDPIVGDDISPCISQGSANGTATVAVLQGKESAVYDARGNGDGEIAPTMTGDHENRVTDYTALCVGNGQANQSVSDKAGALNTMHDKQAVIVTAVFGICSKDSNAMKSANPNSGFYEAETTRTLDANGGNLVRRLTPLECERLQGYPDGWTDIGDWVDSKGKKHKGADSPRYKALGNSIALPFWFWLLRRISGQYERPATMGSLFDGIGGFPLCWERCNGKGTALWASEIEEFPIAVTKVRFPDENVI